MTLRCLCCCRCATEIRLREDMTRLLTRHGQSVVLGVCSRSLAFGISIFHFRHPTCKFVSKGKNQNEWFPIGFPLCQPPCWRRLTPKREHVYLPLVFLFGFPLVSFCFPRVFLLFSSCFPFGFLLFSLGILQAACARRHCPPPPAQRAPGPRRRLGAAAALRAAGRREAGEAQGAARPGRIELGVRGGGGVLGGVGGWGWGWVGGWVGWEGLGGLGGVGVWGGGFGLSVRCKALSVSRTASTH